MNIQISPNEIDLDLGGDAMPLLNILKHGKYSKEDEYRFEKDDCESDDISVKKKRVETLTRRERETYLMLLKGYSLRLCAEEMGVKYPTVNSYQTAIYKKLGVNSKAMLIVNYRDVN